MKENKEDLKKITDLTLNLLPEMDVVLEELKTFSSLKNLTLTGNLKKLPKGILTCFPKLEILVIPSGLEISEEIKNLKIQFQDSI